jgi:hypothetical protein
VEEHDDKGEDEGAAECPLNASQVGGQAVGQLETDLATNGSSGTGNC